LVYPWPSATFSSCPSWKVWYYHIINYENEDKQSFNNPTQYAGNLDYDEYLIDWFIVF
jgi:hypothetical protein